MYINQKSKDRIKLSKRSIIFLVTIAVVVIILIIGLALLLSRGKEVEETLAPLPFSSDSKYFSLENNIVYNDDTLLTCIDSSLDTVWQVQLFSGDLDFVSNDGIIAIVGEDIIDVVSDEGKFICRTTFDSIIKSVRVCDNKFAVYLDQQKDDDSPSYIVVFDLNADSLYEIEVTGRHILDYDFDEQGDLLYLLELDVSGTAPVSRISTYRAETQAMTGIKELKDQLIGEMFIQDSTVYAIGTNRMSVFPSMSAEEHAIMIYGWILKDIHIEDEPLFVFVPSQNASDHIDTVRIVEKESNEITINLPPDVFNIFHEGEKIYCFASDNIFVYTSEGEYLRTHPLPFEIDSVQKAIDGFVYITVDKTVYLLPLP